MGRLGKVDPSSYSQPELITTKHSVLQWKIDFDNTKLKGSVTHHFNVLENNVEAIVSQMIAPHTHMAIKIQSVNVISCFVDLGCS